MNKLFCILLILLPLTGLALTSEERLPDPAMEDEAHELFRQIRCVVCSGESINDSKADLAKDMRILIRKQIAEGKSEREIKSFLTNSYGEDILMATPLNPSTYLLWLGPVIMLFLGVIVVFFFFRRRQ